MAKIEDYIKKDDNLDAEIEDLKDDNGVGFEEEDIDTNDGEDENNSGEELFKVPSKFEGKSVEDIAKAYTELETAYGRQANEYGDLRKLTDKVLFDQLDSEKPKDNDKPVRKAVTFDDLVDDPDTAVDKLVAEKLQPLNDKLEDFEKKERLNSFKSEFPDYEKDLADENFQAWVQGSKYRTNLFIKANQYDTDASSELWGEWKERKEVMAERMDAARAEKESKQDKALKKATSETGSTGARTRQVYKRRDLIDLKARDPEKYYANIEDYKAAYREGRVK